MEILMAVITEEDIRRQDLNPESRLKVLVNNNGKQPPKP